MVRQEKGADVLVGSSVRERSAPFPDESCPCGRKYSEEESSQVLLGSYQIDSAPQQRNSYRGAQLGVKAPIYVNDSDKTWELSSAEYFLTHV